MKQLEHQLLCQVVGGSAADQPAVSKEIVAIATGAAIAGAVGGGIGASYVIESAGGLGALGSLGPAATATLSAAGGALVAAGGAGYLAGSALYQNSEMVQNGAQALVGAVLSTADALCDMFSSSVATVWEQNFPVSGVQLGGGIWEDNFAGTEVHL